MRRAGLATIVLAGCGRLGFDPTPGAREDAMLDAPPPPFVAPWGSGTRIKARVMRPVDGGDPIWFGWHDTLFDTDCLGGIDRDGIERCLPTFPQITTLFADAACTQPLTYRRTPTCTVERYAVSRDAAFRSRIFDLGPAYVGPIFTTETGPCLPGGLPPDVTAYEVGSEVDPSVFVPVTYENVMHGGFVHVEARTPDGSRFAIGTITELVAGRTCSPSGGRLGPTPCHEPTDAMEPVYLDAACAQRAYYWNRGASDPMSRDVFIVETPSMCGKTIDTYDVIADVTTATHYVKSASGCTARATPADDRLYTATLAPAAFPTGEVTIGPRRGRLGKLYWTGSDGYAFPIADWDHDLGHVCTVFYASDGALRCLPSRPQLTPVALGTTCTGAVVPAATACFGETLYDGPNYESCSDGLWIVRPMAKQSDAASLDDEGTCRTVSSPGGVFTVSTGAEVPPQTFPELVHAVE